MANNRRVLIVEDDPGTSGLLVQIVRRAGYEPALARSGREALRDLDQSGADLLLLDLMMKEMDGWTLLDIIRADSRFPSLPVIIISARHPREDPTRVEAYADKYDAYLVKPFEVDELVATMGRLLDACG
ncbi:MAG: response regulator [Anaerolineae bacterium]|jgi:two-component system, OmpR family, response regulator